MHWLDTKIPPPIVMVLLGITAFGVARFIPVLSFEYRLSTFEGIAIAFVGVALNILPKLAFQRAGTTVNPLRPALATSLVTSGIYRYTRNPMYLGHSVDPAGLGALPTQRGCACCRPCLHALHHTVPNSAGGAVSVRSLPGRVRCIL
jgi:protein-S-isoprenylcysteine O-methyltransferase Ste14